MYKKIFFSLAFMLMFTTLKAQCPDPNTFQLQHLGTGVAGLTPDTLNETVRAYGTWAGNYVVLNAVEGRRYKISQLDSEALLVAQFGHTVNGYPAGAPIPNISFRRPQVDHDPMITLYDNTGGTGGFMLSGNILAFNEDASPTEKLSELEYVAPYTGIIYIAVDIQPGTVAYNTGTGPPNVQISSAPADCGLIFQDSTVVSVTWIPDSTLSSETEEERLSRTVWIYPNPSQSGKFMIGNYGVTLQSVDVLDINGRNVYNTNLNGTIEGKELNLDLEAGIYFVRIKSDKASVVKKLIVK